MKKIYLAILIFTTLLVLGACGSKQESEHVADKKQDSISVEVMELKQSSYISEFESTGTFTTDDEVYLSFQTGGIIESILVKESDYVKKGQLLAQLNLTHIKAQHEQALIAYEKSQRDYQRVKNLYSDSVATLEQMQNTASLMDLAKQQLISAEYALKNSSIYATESGFVLRKMANPGQVVGAGNPVLMVNGAGKNNWMLRVPVSDKHWSRIQIGDEAKVEIEALNLYSLSAKVKRKSEMADPYTGTFLIDVELLEENKQLAAGMIGKVVIESNKQQKVWSLPYESLLDADGKRADLFVLVNGNQAKRVSVEISNIDKNTVQISKGLDAFEYLISKGNAYLKDGSLVTISKKQ